MILKLSLYADPSTRPLLHPWVKSPSTKCRATRFNTTSINHYNHDPLIVFIRRSFNAPASSSLGEVSIYKVSGDSIQYNITNLNSSTLYECRIAAATKKGLGKSDAGEFWTKIGDISAPTANLERTSATDNTVNITL